MKKQLVAIGCAFGGTALSGIALAQVAASAWPRVGLADLDACRPVISQVHSLEQGYIRRIISEECDMRRRMYSPRNCTSARKWLEESRSKDDAVWYFEGNDRCQSSDYPCYGVKIYNEVRRGNEAQRWAQYILEKSGKPYNVTRGMDLWTAAREADTCVAQIWANKFRVENGYRARVEPTPAPVEDASPVQLAKATPAGPPPPTEAKDPLSVTNSSSDAEQIAGAAGDAAAAAGAATAAAAAGATAAFAAPAEAASEVAEAAAPAATEVAEAAAAEPATTEAAAAETAAAETAVADAAPAAAAPAVLKRETSGGSADPMQPVLALIAAGKTAEAIAMGDKLAASQPEGEGQLTACKTRVMAKQDLDKALIACYSTGKSGDPEVLETRGQVHLLAGRQLDAWNDFNAAWTVSQANSSLFLRGLASAGLGRTTDAVKDMATAEEAEQGIINTYGDNGYTLAAVMSGKPLAGSKERQALVSATNAAPAPAAKVAASSAKPAAAPKAAAPVSGPTLSAPAAPSAPLTASSAPTEPAPEKSAAPETKAEASDAALNTGRAPTSLAGEPVSIAAAVAATGGKAVSAVAGSPVAVPGLAKPPATDCIEPLPQGAPGNPLPGNAFRNNCEFPVRFTYCISQPAIGSNAEAYTCGKTARYRTDILAPKGVQLAEVGREMSYFACRGPSLPEVAYTKDNGLEGYCR